MATGSGSWLGLYRAGGWAAQIFVVMVLVPVFLVFVAPLPPAGDGTAVLAYVEAHRVVYVVQLVCFVGLSLPALVVFAAVGVAQLSVDRSTATLGALIGVASEIVALSVLSSPQSLHAGILVLASDYAAADALHRPALAAAAEALTATANTVTPAGIMTAMAIFVLSLGMTKRGPFPRWLGILGVGGGILGVVLEALRPFVGAVYLAYGLFLPVWFLAVGLRLLALARAPAP